MQTGRGPPVPEINEWEKKVNNNVILLYNPKKKQEAHGPHRSPEKTVQINKHI